MQMNNLIPRVFKALSLLVILVQASCSFACGGHLQLRVNANLNSDVIHADTGSVIYKLEGTLASLTSSNIKIQCEKELNPLTKNISIISIGRMSGISTGKRVYATNLPGVGIRISVAKKSSQGFQWQPLPFSSQDTLASGLSASDFSVRIELIKTSEVMRHGVIFYHEGNALIMRSNGGYSPTAVDVTVIANLSPGTCRILTDTINVAMGSTNVDEFKTGTGIPNSIHQFSVPVHCENVNSVFFSIHGKRVESSNTILSLLSGSDNAKGIGIQILYEGSPVVIGRPINISSDFTQAENLDVSFSARFVTTANAVLAGKVNCVATIRIDYI
ncbi:UNVERIFIED_ORG: type 1 fimbria pilin [Buttiauxella agrestis ATCC 33320]